MYLYNIGWQNYIYTIIERAITYTPVAYESREEKSILMRTVNVGKRKVRNIFTRIQ